MNNPTDPSSEPDPMPPWKQRAVAAEINGRRVNEAIERGERSAEAVFVCECGNLGCTTTIALTIVAYEAVRTDFDRFLLVPGHEIAGVDEVVEQHRGYLVVVKREPAARAQAEDADVRSE